MHYHVLSSKPSQGQLGVQIWFHKTLGVARSQGSVLAWDASSFAIISASPRHLLVSAKLGHIGFAVLSAHAPTSASSVETIRLWWKQLDSIVKQIPPRHTPIIMIDANARFTWSAQAPQEDGARNDNARQMAQWLRTHHMVASPNELPCGTRVVSYLGPMHTPACLDYVVIPQALCCGFRAKGAIDTFRGSSDHDHFPVVAELTLHVIAHIPRPKQIWDTAALRTEAGRTIVKGIIDRVLQQSVGLLMLIRTFIPSINTSDHSSRVLSQGPNASHDQGLSLK